MTKSDGIPTDDTLRAFQQGQLSDEETAAVVRWLNANPNAEARLRLLTGQNGESEVLILGPSGPSQKKSAEDTELSHSVVVGMGTKSPNGTRTPEFIREYQLVKQLGQGGMGSVYLARHRRLQRDVALKVLPPQLATDPWYRGRFEREMAAVGGLDHPNLVRAYDAGLEGEHLFLSMELLEGEDLANLVSQKQRLPIADACEVIRQAALGLHDAHERGLVHRDIKPANLFLTRSGIVKVIDLGLARVLSHDGPLGDGLSAAQTLVGTPEYMSPEQWESTEVDRRADIYGLGCTLYHLLTGSPPFGKQSGGGWTKLAVAHTMHAPPSLRDSLPDAPKSLADLLSRLLAKVPNQRPDDAATVAAELAPFTAGNDLVAVMTGEASRQTLTRSNGTRRRTAAVVLASLAVLALVGFGISQFAGSPPSPTPTPTPTSAELTPTPVPPKPVDPVIPTGPVTLQAIQSLKLHTDGVVSVAYSPNGKVLATGSKDKTILLWDTKTWKTRPPLEGHRGEVIGLAFSPDSEQLASVTSARDACAIRLWDVETASAKKTFGEEVDGMFGVVWSADGSTLACAGWGSTLYIWDAKADKPRFVIPDAIDKKFVRGLTISRDGKQIVTGGGNDGITRVWDATKGEEIPTDRAMPLGMCPTFLPGDKAVVGWIFRHGQVAICDLPSGKIRQTWKAHPKFIEGLAVSADGRFIASAGHAGDVIVWSTTDYKEVASVASAHRGRVATAAFSPDGTQLATGGFDDWAVQIWELPAVCHTRK
ncbi:MAG: serine/threonine protein kinase [Planctomycetes bacterium]|nr:serine/threonine protein kinase [Planctomycetota bacterium]